MTEQVRRRPRWESALLAAMAYPANLAFAGLAAFLLAVPVVTWLTALIAAGRALDRWVARDDDRVFTNTFQEFRALWRRTLALSVLATVVVFVLVINLLFLGDQGTSAAYLLGMATVPVAAMLVLVVVMLPAAAVQMPDGTAGEWLRLALSLGVRGPVVSLALVVVVIGFLLTCVLLPTMAPFFGLSLPAWLGLKTVRRARPLLRR